jgi:hypothetical protein
MCHDTRSSSSGFGWGEQLEYGNNKLFYLASVTQEEAQKLFDHLVQVEFFDPENDVVIQLRKEEGIYEVRMPIKDGIDPTDANWTVAFRTAACELETYVFPGSDVHWIVVDVPFDDINKRFVCF